MHGKFSRPVKWAAGATAVVVLGAVTVGGAFRSVPRWDTDVILLGRELFVHEWQPNDSRSLAGDGLGPVFNARSCAECHFQGGVGGAGPNRHNVLAFEVDPTPHNPDGVITGVVHAAAVAPEWRESRKNVQELFPIVREGEHVIGSCFRITRDFDPVRFHTVNTPALFGAGLIDRIPDGAIRRNLRKRQWAVIAREMRGDFHSTGLGEPRKLAGGRLGKFGWKGQFATLEEFVATACAVELGLTNPLRAQDEPCRYRCQQNAPLDISRQQLNALVAFVAELPRPAQRLPEVPAERAAVERGRALFAEIGCADCHAETVGDVVGIYSDFLLHTVAPPKEIGLYGRIERDIPLPPDHPDSEEWQTPPLWGVADSAPYFHDGKSPTLEAAILRHHGEAEQVRKRFQRLSDREQAAVLDFLNTLRAPQTAEPPGVQTAARTGRESQ